MIFAFISRDQDRKVAAIQSYCWRYRSRLSPLLFTGLLKVDSTYCSRVYFCCKVDFIVRRMMLYTGSFQDHGRGMGLGRDLLPSRE